MAWLISFIRRCWDEDRRRRQATLIRHRWRGQDIPLLREAISSCEGRAGVESALA